jgi:hypothetical protein
MFMYIDTVIVLELGVVGIIRGNSFYTLSFRRAITSIKSLKWTAGNGRWRYAAKFLAAATQFGR